MWFKGILDIKGPSNKNVSQRCSTFTKSFIVRARSEERGLQIGNAGIDVQKLLYIKRNHYINTYAYLLTRLILVLQLNYQK